MPQKLQRDATARTNLLAVFSDRMPGGVKALTTVLMPGGSFTIGPQDEERERFAKAGGSREDAACTDGYGHTALLPASGT